MSALPRVGIVVLNWNNERVTRRCLDSLAAITYPAATVYLADNGSTDGSREALQRSAPERGVRFIDNGANLGFSAGCNPAIRAALADGCDYVLLFNNDCIATEPGFLEEGIRAAREHPRCGIVGGKIRFWPETERIWSTGGFIRFWGGETHVGHGEIDRGQHDRPARRTFISGALMLIRREVFEAIGLLPEVYFFGKEEWEFSARAARAGFDLLYEPRFVASHEASNSTDAANLAFVYNGTLSKILYKRRNMPAAAFALWWLVFGLYLFVLFPIKYRLRRGTYLQGASPAALRAAMIRAYRDAPHTEKITGQMLADFGHREGAAT